MLLVEIIDGNRIHYDRLAANGFKEIPERSHSNRTSSYRFGEQVEVWGKDDGSKQITNVDFSDLPEVED